MLLGDAQGIRNDNLTDIDNDGGETPCRNGRRSRGGAIQAVQAVGVETHGAGRTSIVECVIGVVERCADKRADQNTEA